MVALLARHVDSFTPDLDLYRVFLVYGPDSGRVTSLAWRLLKYVGVKKEDSFSYTTLEGETLGRMPGRLLEEGGALMLFSPCRALRIPVRGQEKSVVKALEIYKTAAPHGIPVVIEADDLDRQSPLRLFCERASFAVTLPCYTDDPSSLMTFASEFFSKRGITCDSEVYPLLATWLGADRRNTESELEKLACYASSGSSLSSEEVLNLLGDGASVFATTVVDALYEGHSGKADRDFSRFIIQGYSPHIALSVAIAHGFFLMGEVLGITNAGSPIHFKRRSSLQRQCRRWTFEKLCRALASLGVAQMYVRQTRMTMELERSYIRMAFLRIALGF
jgi:DNA polymerase-3 subunit delta